MVGYRNILTDRGQSTVEYILLLVVVISLASVVFKTKLFQNIFGEDSDFMATLIGRMEYAYRHGRMGEGDQLNYQRHPTFYNQDKNESRFFSPLEPYPKR